MALCPTMLVCVGGANAEKRVGGQTGGRAGVCERDLNQGGETRDGGEGQLAMTAVSEVGTRQPLCAAAATACAERACACRDSDGKSKSLWIPKGGWRGRPRRLVMGGHLAGAVGAGGLEESLAGRGLEGGVDAQWPSAGWFAGWTGLA